MSKPTLALDVESTMANTHGRMLAKYNSRHGTDYELDDVTSWNWVGDVIDFDEFMGIMREIWANHETLMPLETGLGDTVEELSKVFDVDIVTAHEGVEDEMQRWFKDHRITDYNEFHSGDHTLNKAEMGYDYLIDDKPSLAANLSGSQVLYLRDQPYNRNVAGDGVVRVSEVADVLDEHGGQSDD